MLQANSPHRPAVRSEMDPHYARPVFKPKGPPFSVRMVGMIGSLCIVLGLLGVVLGIGLMGDDRGGNAIGGLIAAWSLAAVAGGFLYLAAYHVAAAVIEMRDIALHQLNR